MSGEFSDDSDVSVVLTSCGRFDLLRQTLESFFRYNTYPLRDFFLIEDSKKSGVKNCIPKSVRGWVKIMVNRPPAGQAASIDRAYAEVNTKYIFHCEDDWLFYRPGFIEDSKKVLVAEPYALVVQLRSYHHDLVDFAIPRLLIGERNVAGGVAYNRLESRSDNSCFSFNPGLRRRNEYFKDGFAALAGEENAEQAACKKYSAQGYFSVLLENDAVKHTGFGRHVGHHPRPRGWKKHRSDILRFFVAVAMVALGYWLGART